MFIVGTSSFSHWLLDNVCRSFLVIGMLNSSTSVSVWLFLWLIPSSTSSSWSSLNSKNQLINFPFFIDPTWVFSINILSTGEFILFARNIFENDSFQSHSESDFVFHLFLFLKSCLSSCCCCCLLMSSCIKHP